MVGEKTRIPFGTMNIDRRQHNRTVLFKRQLFFETKIRFATKIIKNQGVIFNDNCCQFLMSIIVNSGILFVFALMKCSQAAFGEQNKNRIIDERQ
jgi:hypothetical protein